MIEKSIQDRHSEEQSSDFLSLSVKTRSEIDPLQNHFDNVFRMILAGLLSATLTIAFLVFLAGDRPLNTVTQTILDEFIPEIWPLIRGRELDRELFVAGLFLFPTLLALISWLLRFVTIPFAMIPTLRIAPWIVTITVIGTVCWAGWLTTRINVSLFWRRDIPFHRMVIIFICFAIWVIALAASEDSRLLHRWKALKLTPLVVFLHLIVIFWMNWIDADQIFATRSPHHFNAVFDGNVQVYLGRPLMCNGLIHQYGLYPHFLEPLFRVTGLTVKIFSAVMQILTVFVFWLFYLALERYLSRTTWVAAIWLSVVYIIYLLPFVDARVPLDWNVYSDKELKLADTFYQWMPLRLLFPGILLFLIGRDTWFSGWRFWIAQFLFSIGILWNIDLGLVSWLTWQAVICYRGIQIVGISRFWEGLRNGIINCLKAVAIAVLTGLLFVVYIKCRYSQWPDWTEASRYQRIFYEAGYHAFPMLNGHTWQAVLLVYAIALVIAFYGIWAGDESKWFRITFGFSIFGCGCFSYYVGRSEDTALSLVCFPALMIAGAIVERWQSLLKKCSGIGWQLTYWSVLIPAAVLFAVSSGSNLDFLPEIWKFSRIPSRHTFLEAEHALVKKWSAKPGRLVVLSVNRSGLLTLASGKASAVKAPSLMESPTVSQMNQWISLMEDEEHTYVAIDTLDLLLMPKTWEIVHPYLLKRPGRTVEKTPKDTLIIIELSSKSEPRP